MINNFNYIKTWKFDTVSVYEKDTTGNLLKTNLLQHFNKTIKLVFNSTSSINKDSTFFNKRNMNILNYFRNELNESQLVDIDELNIIYKNLGNSFKNTLIKGLKLRTAGYVNSNKNQFNAGQMLISKWLSWFIDNKTEIQEAFKFETDTF